MARSFLDVMVSQMDRRLNSAARDLVDDGIDAAIDAGRGIILDDNDGPGPARAEPAVVRPEPAETRPEPEIRPEPAVLRTEPEPEPEPEPEIRAEPEPEPEAAAPISAPPPETRPEPRPEPVAAEPDEPAADTGSTRPAVVGSGNSVAAFDSDFQDLQQALGELDPKYAEMMMCSNGQYADGLEGPKSRAAIETFAEENGIDISNMSVTDLTQAVQNVHASLQAGLDADLPDAARPDSDVVLSFGDEFDSDAFDQYFMNATNLRPGELSFSFGATAAPPEPEPEPAVHVTPAVSPTVYDI